MCFSRGPPTKEEVIRNQEEALGWAVTGERLEIDEEVLSQDLLQELSEDQREDLQRAYNVEIENAVRSQENNIMDVPGASGDPEAIRILGCVVRDGHGRFGPNPFRALRMFKRAVAGGNIQAMVELGDLWQEIALKAEEDRVRVYLSSSEELYQRAIDEGGSVDAMVCLGRLRQTTDEVAAGELYQRAIDEGSNGTAMKLLGRLVENGYGGERPDGKRAAEMYRMASEAGCADAIFCLAALTERGYGDVKPDVAGAVALYERIEGGRMTRATVRLGMLKCSGYDGFEGDKEVAVKIFDRALQAILPGEENPGSADAMYERGYLAELGFAYRHGNQECTAKLYREAIEHCTSDCYSGVSSGLRALLRRAFGNHKFVDGYCSDAKYLPVLQNGPTPLAMFELAKCISEGSALGPSDPGKAVAILEELVEKYNVKGTFNQLGSIVETGYDFVAPNEARAFSLYEKGMIEQKDCHALENFCLKLWEGSSYAPPQRTRAVETFKQFMEENDISPVASTLASFLKEGYDDTEPDLAMAKDLLQKAVEYGDTSSLLDLAQIIEKGYGSVRPRPGEASLLYEKCCEELHEPVAMYRLAMILLEGSAEVPVDSKRAVKLLREAIGFGNAEAKCKLGWILLEGYDEEAPDPAAAKDIFLQAWWELKGSPEGWDAAVGYAIVMKRGYQGQSPQPRTSADILEKIIRNRREPRALSVLAELINEGYGDVAPNPDGAVELYHESFVKLGFVPAFEPLFLLVANGHGNVGPNKSEAIKLCRRAIDLGCEQARTYMANIVSEENQSPVGHQ